jgi:hypothetical protein
MAQTHPHLNRLPALSGTQQLVHGLVMRGLLGIFLQGLRQGVHGQTLRCGGQLGPHIGTTGLQLGDAVIALGVEPNISRRAGDGGIESIQLAFDRLAFRGRRLRAVKQTQG